MVKLLICMYIVEFMCSKTSANRTLSAMY